MSWDLLEAWSENAVSHSHHVCDVLIVRLTQLRRHLTLRLISLLFLYYVILHCLVDLHDDIYLMTSYTSVVKWIPRRHTIPENNNKSFRIDVHLGILYIQIHTTGCKNNYSIGGDSEKFSCTGQDKITNASWSFFECFTFIVHIIIVFDLTLPFNWRWTRH